MKITTLFILWILLFAFYSLQAQVAISSDGSSADASAMLEVKSNEKGFLPPRMTLTERDAISNPATGLIIYQTNETSGLYHYNGSAWMPLKETIDGSETKLNAGTNVTITGSGTVANPYVADAALKCLDQTGINALTPTAGMLVYNTDTYKLNVYNGTDWLNTDGTLASSLTIGMLYKGGVLAYVLQSGDPGFDANVPHGVIAAPSDQSADAQWGCENSSITGAYGMAIGSGASNTQSIVAGCSTAGIAARICSDLVLGGFSDWYLPSLDELYKLYLNRTAIGGFTSGAYYWSSTDATQALGASFWAFSRYFANSYGNAVPVEKEKPYGSGEPATLRVRAIRSF